ncbi:NPP1 family protein [Streptomyces sp. NBC_01214]|nr:NPP1 family protein [Streptomyces sp. NBC_01214]
MPAATSTTGSTLPSGSRTARRNGSASQHGGYEIKAADDVLWDGTHPKLVYHKDGASTHNFRFASSGDEPPENHYHRWIRSPLVSYNGFPRGLRDKLFDHDFDHASIAIKDSSYPSDLKAAIPFYVTPECKSNAHGGTTCSEIKNPMFPFDYTRDENSPGDPNPPAEPPDTPRPTDPLKVMVVGDSMTQGHEGMRATGPGDIGCGNGSGTSVWPWISWARTREPCRPTPRRHHSLPRSRASSKRSRDRHGRPAGTPGARRSSTATISPCGEGRRPRTRP